MLSIKDNCDVFSMKSLKLLLCFQTFSMKRNGLLLWLYLLSGITVYAQTFTPVEGMHIGPNFIVWEAEATESPLGYWEIIDENDPRYQDSDNNNLDPILGTHLEFTGNNHNSGPPTSPLEYTFVAPKTGTYKLGARMFQRLEGLPSDKCNDLYIKMEGNFTSGNHVDKKYLTRFVKFYGRGVNQWGALYNLEIHATGQHANAVYNLIEGEIYTLTVAGRAQRTNVDYWILFETSLPITLKANTDIATEHSREYLPLPTRCSAINAAYMNYKDIDGFTDASIDTQAGVDILQIANRDAWAAAQHIYQGTNGEAEFVINTMQEIDGESTYRLKINGELIGEVTNDRIYGTEIPDYTIQSHIINEDPVELNFGDTIQVEFNNTSNGLVPEGDLTATARGRWVSLEFCTTGFPGYYHLNFSQNSYNVSVYSSLKLDLDFNFPSAIDPGFIWTSSDRSVADVDSNGVITGNNVGSTIIIISTTDGLYTDTCTVSVLPPASGSIRKTYQNKVWQFPGDTLSAWQYDYVLTGMPGDTLFALDSAVTIGVYGCNDDSGENIREYHDAEQLSDAAQFQWDVNDQTFSKNGQWVEFTTDFKDQIDYQLVLRARKNADARFKLTVFNMQGDTVFYKDVSIANDFTKTGSGNKQTEWLLSNFQLMDIWKQHIVRFDWYDNIGAPGIFGSFSFQKSNIDITPPTWGYVDIGSYSTGAEIVVMVDEDATVYMVPEGTAPDSIIIRDVAVSSVEAEAYIASKLETFGVEAGNYVVYAIDPSNNISEASSIITLQKPVSSQQVFVAAGVNITYSSASEMLRVESTSELRQIEVFNICGEKLISRQCQGKMDEFSTNGLTIGVYIVRITATEGTLSIQKFVLW